MTTISNTSNTDPAIVKGATVTGLVLRIGHESPHGASKYLICLMLTSGDGFEFLERESYFVSVNMGLPSISAGPFPCFPILQTGDVLTLNFNGLIYKDKKIVLSDVNSYSVTSPGAQYQINLASNAPASSAKRDEWEEF